MRALRVIPVFPEELCELTVHDFTEYVILKRKALLMLFLVLAIPASYYTLQQKHDNNLDVFFDKSDHEWVKYKEFQEIYGNEEVVVIVIHHENVFSKPVLEIIDRIGGAVKDIDGVHTVTSITEAESPVIEDDGETVRFLKFFPKGDFNGAEIETAKNRLADSRLIQNFLYSGDGRVAAIVVVIECLMEKDKKRVVEKIYQLASRIAGKTADLRFAGIPATETEMNRIGFRDVIVLGIATYIIVFFIIFFLVKNLTLSLLVQVNLLMTFVFSIGLYVFSGEKFNMVTTSMGVVLLSICVADAIHFLSQYREDYIDLGQDYVQAVKHAVGHVWMPCLFTSLTTGVGFLSFAAGSIRPARIYGIFTCIGVMIAFFLTMTLLPILVVFLKNVIHPEKKTLQDRGMWQKKDGTLAKLILKIGTFTIRHHKLIGISGILILIISIAGITRIQFETDLVKYFPKDNAVKQDQIFVEKHLGGIVPVLLRIQATSDSTDFNHAESVKFLDDIQNHILANVDNFTSAFSVTDIFKEINRAFNGGREAHHVVPESDLDIMDYYELSPSEEVDRLVRPDHKEAVVTFMTVWQSLEKARSVYRLIDDYMAKKVQDKFTYEMTGYRSLMMSMGVKMKESQLRSLFVALVIVFLMMYLVCRSVPLTLFAMIPNVLPIVMIYGIMGWFGIALDIVTLMVGSIVMGIAVDDTVHFIIWFRRNMARETSIESALLRSFKDVGKPIVITTIVLFLGFIIFIFGTMVPTRFFGVLVAFSILFALLGDFFILPAVIMIFKPKVRPIHTSPSKVLS